MLGVRVVKIADMEGGGLSWAEKSKYSELLLSVE